MAAKNELRPMVLKLVSSGGRVKPENYEPGVENRSFGALGPLSIGDF
jgi:hypothetical protein